MTQRILVVDDDTNTLRILVTLLRSEGFSADGYDAVDAAAAQLRVGGYDVLLTDLAMPGANGHELVATTRQSHPDVRCIIMSGFEPDGELSADVTWVRKPIDIDELVATLAGG